MRVLQSVQVSQVGSDYVISGNYQGTKFEQTINFGALPVLILFDPDTNQFVPFLVEGARSNWLVVDFIDKPE